jgi:FAD/FMN-containing dehydrogenase
VTADGRLVRADAETEPELFWAVRGGGGSFGVVTALEFELYPVAEIYAGALFWPAERAREILGAWCDWVETVPREVTSVGRLMQFPSFPQVPEPLRGNAFVIVEAAILGPADEAAPLLAPLRALGPAMDTATTIPAAALSKVHMDPPGPVPGVGDGTMLAALPAEAVDALVEVAGPRSGSPLVSVELRHLGGALAEAPAGHGAMAGLDGEFALFAVGSAPTPEQGAASGAHIVRVLETLAPWQTARTYSNFTSRRIGAGDLFPGEAVRRLRELKAQVDPDELFRVAHPIAPATP